MKLAILSRNGKLYSTRRLVEAARQRGHSVRVLDPLRCYLRISSDGFDMHYKGKPIAGYGAVVPRIGASITRYGCAVLRQFELMGSYSPNSAAAIARARDKLRCHQVLAAEGIGLPVTVFGDNPDDTADLRCFVVGDRVVAAMRRQAPKGDFRSNLHRGGSARPVRPSRAEVHTAVRAAGLLGLGVAGVDLIRSKRGPLVLEVNSSPGLEGIEQATGIDVAGAVVEHVVVRAAGLQHKRNADLTDS